ncbi:MAG TPA: hypothetical protein VMK32_06725 [Burkholderiaceae bacterium]|nr:hypothetical protein [Burkholderiaceae bacterium]
MNTAALLTLVSQPATSAAAEADANPLRAEPVRPRVSARGYSVREASDAAWLEALDQWRARQPAP